MSLLREVEAEIEEVRGVEPFCLDDVADQVERGILQQPSELMERRIIAALVGRQIVGRLLECSGSQVEADFFAAGGILSEQTIIADRIRIFLFARLRRLRFKLIAGPGGVHFARKRTAAPPADRRCHDTSQPA